MSKSYTFLKYLMSLWAFLFLINSEIISQNFNIGGDEDAQFFVGFSPVVLDKDQIEINLLNSVNSFWLEFKEFHPSINGVSVIDRSRFTRADHILRAFYGFSSSARWDLGAEFRFSHSRLDANARSSVFDVFKGDSETGRSFRGISTAGFRVRYAPSEDIPGLTLQGYANFRVNTDEETRSQLADRTEVGISPTYYQALNNSTFFLIQTDWRMLLKNDENQMFTQYGSLGGFLIVDVFEQYVYAFGGMNYTATINRKFKRLNQQLYGGLGLQYQIPSGLSFYIYGQVPFIFDSGNLFIDWVRESYSSVTLGARMIIGG